MPISEAEKHLIYFELEKTKFKSSNAVTVFNRATVMYFIMLLFAVIGLVGGYINSVLMNTLVIMAVIILIAGAIPYFRSMNAEKEELDMLIREVKK